MKATVKRILVLCLLGSLLCNVIVLLSGCESQSSMEEAVEETSEAVEESVEETGEVVEDAVDTVEDEL